MKQIVQWIGVVCSPLILISPTAVAWSPHPLNVVKAGATTRSTTRPPIHSTSSDHGSEEYRKEESKEDLIALARNLNPIVGYFDPLELVDGNFWDGNQSSTIGFLRHSEIKHGRVAMAAFVGYCVQSNFHWPWAMTLDRQPFPSTTLCPQEQWDVLPLPAKLQILTFIGFLEFFSEYAQPVHYMKGGKPGYFPSLKGSDLIPHPVWFNLYDPFGLNNKMTASQKERRLMVEINNGRLAMIGIMAFLCEAKLPGSIPLLSEYVKPYGGEVMAPFQ